MLQFAFEATDKMGNQVSGTVSAPNEALAANQIGQMGYVLLSLRAAEITPETTLEIAPAEATPTLATPPARLPLTAYGDRTEEPDSSSDSNTTAEMPPLSRPLEPWERSVPLPQAPLPAVSLSAAGVAMSRTQTMHPGVAVGRTQTMQPGTASGAPGGTYAPSSEENRSSERPRSLPEAEKAFPQLFMEKMVYPIFSGVVLKDLAPYYRQFATLIGAGLPIFQSLMALEGNTKNPKLKEITQAAQAEVQKGGRFSDVIARWPWVFHPVQRHLIRASEETGTLEETLRRIADYVEHDLNIKRMIQREMTYPILVLFVALMILGRPGFLGGDMALVQLVLGSMGKAEYTGVSYFMDTLGFGLLIVVLSLFPIALFRLSLFNVKGVREGYDRFKLGIPVIGKITQMFALARFSRTLAALSRSGFSMAGGLDIAGAASGNAVLEDTAERSRVRAERGEMLSDTLRGSVFFPSMAVDMIRTGETAGRSDEMLDKIAEFNESEGKLKLHQAVVIFGVAVFLVVALMVAMQIIRFYTGYGSNVMSAGEGLIGFLF